MLKVVFDINVIVSAALPALVLCEFREPGGKGAPLIWDTRGCDLPAMSSRNGPGQAESQTNAGLRPALIGSEESLKNAGKIARGNAASCIFNRNKDPCVIL